jgi:hypothetical protein
MNRCFPNKHARYARTGALYRWFSAISGRGGRSRRFAIFEKHSTIARERVSAPLDQFHAPRTQLCELILERAAARGGGEDENTDTRYARVLRIFIRVVFGLEFSRCDRI